MQLDRLGGNQSNKYWPPLNQKNETCDVDSYGCKLGQLLDKFQAGKKGKVDLLQTISNYSWCYFSVSSFKIFLFSSTFALPLWLLLRSQISSLVFIKEYLIKNAVQCHTIYPLILHCCFDTITDCKVLHSVCPSSSPSSCLGRGT